jgi:hypothetical protein
MIAIVEQHWAAREDFAPSDLSAVYLLLGYVRAFRCFDSIKLLADDGRNDDALVLLRSLVSVILRSLYLVVPDDPEERELRRRRTLHEEFVAEERRLRLAAHPGEAEQLPEMQDQLQQSRQWFEEHEESPGLPGEASLAQQLGLGALYDIVYRIASKTTHHSALAAIGSFEGEAAEGQLFPAVPLHRPMPELTENVLLWAIVAYRDFLAHAEETIGFGIASEVDEIVVPWVEAHPYRDVAAD